MDMKRNVGILLFDDVEVLDFAGPFEVFSVTSELNNYEPFNVFTISIINNPITARNGLSVNPDYDFDNHPSIDILIIPGGNGTNNIIDNDYIMKWVHDRHTSTEYTMSICSGARILGKLGLLENKPYCTHKSVYEDMKKIVPSGLPRTDLRYIDAGKIFTSGGISAGIDLSFHLISLMHGKEIAIKTAEYMEYPLKPDNA